VLEGGESGEDAGAVHPAQELRARAAVTVLPGQRATVCHDDICCLLLEGSLRRASGVGKQVVVDAHVDAALTEVAVEQSVPVVAGQQGSEVAQIIGQPLGWDGRVLPSGPGLAALGTARGKPSAPLADTPDGRLLCRLVEEAVVNGSGIR